MKKTDRLDNIYKESIYDDFEANFSIKDKDITSTSRHLEQFVKKINRKKSLNKRKVSKMKDRY